jgi:GINS complex subunit 1
MVDRKFYGEEAIELLKDIRRHNLIDIFNESARRKIIDETNALFRHVESILRESKETGTPLDASQVPIVLLESNSFVRNKRCFLAYLMERARRIQKLRWEVGGVIPEDIKKNMAKTEIEYFSRYDKLLGNYMRSFATTLDMDLTANLYHPPKELQIEVKVLQDFGTIVTESGATITLKKDTRLFLRRTDAEPLIRQGILEHVT